MNEVARSCTGTVQDSFTGTVHDTKSQGSQAGDLFNIGDGCFHENIVEGSGFEPGMVGAPFRREKSEVGSQERRLQRKIVVRVSNSEAAWARAQKGFAGL